MPQCAIKNCQSNLGPKSPYYSYNFPKPEKSPDRFASWCKHTHPSFVASRSSRVCAIHFKLEDFDQSDILKIRLTPDLFKNLTPKLRGGVVPSLNLGDDDDYEEEAKKAALKRAKNKKKGNVRELELGPSTSWTFPAREIKIEEDDEGFETMPPRNSVGIQCEFGAEVYRGLDVGCEMVDK